MWKIMLKLLSYVLFLFSLSAYADDELIINVNTKQTQFVLSLAANPTTGYQWSVVSFDKNLLTLKSSKYLKSPSNLIGSGGQMQYIFSVNKGKKIPPSTNLQFKYARAWEPNAGTLKNVRVNFLSSY